MKINWSFIEPVRDQAARLRGDFTAKSEIVKLAEQQAEIDALKEEVVRLREALKGVIRIADRNTIEFDIARAAIREGGEDRYARG